MENYKKKTKLRSINPGTRYDISGNLRRLTREIEADKMEGRPTAVLVVTSLLHDNGRRTYDVRLLGADPTCVFELAEAAKKRTL